MGKFANESPGVGMRLAPPAHVPPEDRHGFDALGYPVSAFRKEQASLHLKDMGVEDAEKRWDCVQKMSQCIERDKPHEALEQALGFVDATGCYRLLAVLLTAVPPPPPEPPFDWSEIT